MGATLRINEISGGQMGWKGNHSAYKTAGERAYPLTAAAVEQKTQRRATLLAITSSCLTYLLGKSQVWRTEQGKLVSILEAYSFFLPLSILLYRWTELKLITLLTC